MKKEKKECGLHFAMPAKVEGGRENEGEAVGDVQPWTEMEGEKEDRSVEA